MIFNTAMKEIKNALLESDSWTAMFAYSAYSDGSDHIFLYQLDPSILDDKLPICLITNGSAWNRIVQGFGGVFTTNSDIILHFEMKYDDSEYTDNEILEEFSDFVGEVMLDLEKSTACHLLVEYAPESTNTPAISNLSDEESFVSFRVRLRGR